MTTVQIVSVTAEEVAAREQQAALNGLAIGAALLVVIALLALRRARTHDLRMASRPRRIVETAAIWSVVYVAMCTPLVSASAGFMFGASAGLLPIASAALFMLLALALVGTADLLLDALRPRRTLIWLLTGPLLIAGFSIGLLGASHWMDIIRAEPGWREAMLVISLLIAGIGWWSRLPSWESQASDIFD